MKTWYYAVCQEHGEATHVFVSNPSCTEAYLSEHDRKIQGWLEDHFGCELILIHHDLDLEKYMFNDGWIHIREEDGFCIWKRP